MKVNLRNAVIKTMEIKNLGGADRSKPCNGDNGNYDVAGLIINGKLIATSSHYYSDFVDPEFEDLLSMIDFIIDNKFVDTDFVSTVSHYDCHFGLNVNTGYYDLDIQYLDIIGHNFEEACASGCRYFATVGRLKEKFINLLEDSDYYE